MIVRVGAHFSFSAEVHTLFSAIVIWGIYFLATCTQVVTQTEIQRVRYRYEESTPPPDETPIRRPGSKSFHVCSRFFASRPAYNRFQPDGFLFLNLLQKPHLTWEIATLSIYRRYWVNGPTGWVFGMFFSRGEGGDDTGELWTVSIYIQIAQQSSWRQRCWKVVTVGISVYSSAR